MTDHPRLVGNSGSTSWVVRKSVLEWEGIGATGVQTGSQPSTRLGKKCEDY